MSSSGPLTRIIITPDLACQVAHAADLQFELYGGETGSCGTFLAIDGAVYGPASIGATSVPFAPVSQSPLSGRGTRDDPFRLVTVADASAASIRVTQTDSYVVGDQSYRTDVALLNMGSAAVRGFIYRAGDCYPAGQRHRLRSRRQWEPGVHRRSLVGPTHRAMAAADAQQPLLRGLLLRGLRADVTAGPVPRPLRLRRAHRQRRRPVVVARSWPRPVGVFSQETFFSPYGRLPERVARPALSTRFRPRSRSIRSSSPRASRSRPA